MQSTRQYVSSLFTTPPKKTPSRNNRFESYEEFLELQRLLSLLQDKETELAPCAKEALKTGVETLGSVKYEKISNLLKTIKKDLNSFNEKRCTTSSPDTRASTELQEMHDLIKQLRLSVIKVVQAHHETLAGARNHNKSYTSSALKYGLYGVAAAGCAAVSVIAVPAALAGAWYANKKAQQVTGLENHDANTIVILRDITVELDKLENGLAAKIKRSESNLTSKNP